METLTPTPWRLKPASQIDLAGPCEGPKPDPAASTQVTKQDKSRPRWRCRLHLLEEAHQAYTSSSFSCGLLGTHRQADRQKESCTVSLYNIGSSTDFSNWRPIALGNTLCKVWTGIVTQCLAQHAEHFDRLSST